MVLDEVPSNPLVISTHHQTHIDMVSQGQYAYLTDETTSLLKMSKDCSLAMMDQKLSASLYAMGTQNNSAYVELLSHK